MSVQLRHVFPLEIHVRLFEGVLRDEGHALDADHFVAEFVEPAQICRLAAKGQNNAKLIQITLKITLLQVNQYFFHLQFVVEFDQSVSHFRRMPGKVLVGVSVLPIVDSVAIFGVPPHEDVEGSEGFLHGLTLANQPQLEIWALNEEMIFKFETFFAYQRVV